MKNIAYVTIILALFAASCSSHKGGLITKRKYTKGYYVDLGGKHVEAKGHEQKVAEVKNTKPTKATSPALEEVKSLTPAVEQMPVITANAAAAPVQMNVVKELKTEKKRTVSHEKKSVKSAIRNYVAALRAMTKIAHQKGTVEDSNLIVMVILSLFPITALIAIWLHDGRSITLNFWIDLLLHFFFLYWLLALLVVLDVINLA